MTLRLQVRTPGGLVLDQEVRGVVAEDVTGWFGIRPGREDLVAVLPPGLLVFHDDAGEGFVAVSGGLLDLQGPSARVMTPEAIVTRQLDQIDDAVNNRIQSREDRSRRHGTALEDLARHVLRRLVESRR